MNNKMNKKILLLRVSYWVGAIIDAFAAIPMLFPKIAEFSYGLSDFNPGIEYKFAMGIGASLMLGWTLIFIWADRNPVERRGVLLAVLPVIFGNVIVNIYAVTNGFIAMGKMAPSFIMQAILTSLFVFSYVNSRDIK